MQLLAIDLETTGLDPKTDQILEIGMVHQAKDGGRRTFHAYVTHSVYSGNAIALSMNADILRTIGKLETARRKNEEMVETLLEYEEAAFHIANWFKFLADTEGVSKFVPTGKNVGSFDLAFLKMLPGWEAAGKYLHHRCMDPGPIFTRPSDEVPPDLKECMVRAGIPAQVDHRALSDATAVLDVLHQRQIRHEDGGLYYHIGTVKNKMGGVWHEQPLYMNENGEKFTRHASDFNDKFS